MWYELAPMATTTPTLELRGISQGFGSVQALVDVDFEVRDGEVMALVGDNGAGKSTLIKCVAGIHPIDAGEVLLRRASTSHIHGPKDAARLGIEVVYQDLALCDNLDVVQNMYLGREAHDRLPAAEGAGDGAPDGRDAEDRSPSRRSARSASRSRRSPAASASRSRSRAR